MKKKLLNGEKKIYIATRLFNISDKIAGNTLERKVYEILKSCVIDEGNVLEVYPLYLPFRDTNEDQLLGCDNAFQVIYDADISRLEHLHSLITYLDDPTKDDGICMEIGYAYANNVPIILLSSDVQYYRIDRKLAYHSDPIIHRIIAEYIYMPEIPASKYEISSDCEKMELIAEEYEERLKQAEDNILEKLTPIIRKLYEDYDSYIPTPINSELPRKSVCIDMLGGRYEWAKMIEKQIADGLEKRGITYYCTERFSSKEESVIIRGENDIKMLLSSDILAVCADGTETDAGAAALIGMAKKLGKTIILYYSSNCDILEGDSSSLRNLMIELSADSICTTYNDVINTIVSYSVKN